MAKNLIEQVLKTIRTYELLKPGDTVLIACSGGPDSVFLLHAILKLKNKLRLKNIAVCNLDHALRGRASIEDSRFVKRLCRDLSIEFYGKKTDLKHSSFKGLSTEEAGRKARYAFFRDSARKAGATVIATGHTLDDQAETILMRVIKGASLKGLAGISPARVAGKTRIIRPIIELEKTEITAYLDTFAISYRIDSTNREPIYFRNIVRNEIMPFLEKYNPRLKRALSSLAEHLREDYEFISQAKGGAQGIVSIRRDGAVEIALKDLVLQPRVIQKEIMRDCLRSAGGDVKKLSFRHWKELETLINRKGKGSAIHLPGRISAIRGEKTLTLSKI